MDGPWGAARTLRAMATLEEAQQAMLDAITKAATSAHLSSSDHILELCEAWAWLRFPNQMHGTSIKVSQ